MARDPETGPTWPRAVATTAMSVVLGVALLVVVPDLIVSRLGGLDRSGRVALATIWFFAMVAALAWLLRRMQARHLT